MPGETGMAAGFFARSIGMGLSSDGRYESIWKIRDKHYKGYALMPRQVCLEKEREGEVKRGWRNKEEGARWVALLDAV